MRQLAFFLCAFGIFVGAAQAQSFSNVESGGGTVGQLVKNGFEIKSVVLNNGKYVVFLQKDRQAYVCEFVKINQSRCGAIQ